MDYKEFINEVYKRLQERLQVRGLKVTLSNVVKSGDRIRECILISKETIEGTPAIYLDEFFRLYENGNPMEALLNQMVQIYDDARNSFPFSPEDFMNWENARDHITCRLMNAVINDKYLEDAVYIRHLDLAIVVYCTMITPEQHIYSCKVSREMRKEWGMEPEQLYQLGMENTKRLFGISLQEIKDVLVQIARKNGMDPNQEVMRILEKQGRVPMYILSNQIGSQGAVNIFMDDILQVLADNLKDDLYIIPSSIHEVILTPVHNKLGIKEVDAMIRDINLSLLDAQDILSNHVYIYQRKDGEIV